MTDKNFTTRGNEPLEARIVAWVLGEASAFEIDELERLCREQPELAVFKRRIEAIHGLAAEAHNHKDDARWKLSIKKRSAIEELIGAEEAVAEELARDYRAGRSGRRALLAIAACVVMTLVVASVMSPVILSRMKSEMLSSAGSVNDFGGVDELGDGVSFHALSEPEESIANGYTYADKSESKKEARRYREAGSDHKNHQLFEQSGKGAPAAKYEANLEHDSFDAFAPAPPESNSALLPSVTAASNKPSAPRTPSLTVDEGAYLGGQKGQANPAMPAAGGEGPAAERLYRYDGSANTNGLAPSDDALNSTSEKFRNSPGSREAKDKMGASHFGTPAPSVEMAPRQNADVTTTWSLDSRVQVTDGKFKSKGSGDADLAGVDIDALRMEGGEGASITAYGQPGLSPDVQSEIDHARYSLNQANLKSAERILSEKKLAGEKLEKLQSATEEIKNLTQQEALLDEVTKQDKIKEDSEKRPVVTDEETLVAEEPYSTFSLNINDASFRVAQAALARGEMPDPAGIKVEQFYNAVDYGDPSPAAGQPVACNIEQSAHPVIPGRNLVRVALKTASEGRSQGQPLRLTLLIDQSGSMAREDRRAAMVEALDGLRGLLGENDQVNVIGFARTPRLLAEAVKGNEGQLGQLVNIEANEGGTNLEEAIKLGQQLAQRHQLEGAQNRMVLFTDGAANLGDADPDSLADKIKDLRQKGIAFDIAGIVADGLNDELLGEMARHGNGRYYVVGKGEKDRFAQQLAGAFRPAAENVKVQVHFNPERVGRYKLIGFEKDRLNKEDFRNDAVDAAELAAEEAGVAIYQVETLPEGKGEIGEVSVRFRDVASGEMVERSWNIANEIATPALDQARPSMQLATLAMLAGEKLRGGPLSEAINFNEMGEVIAKVNQHFKGDPKAADMLQMIGQLK